MYHAMSLPARAVAPPFVVGAKSEPASPVHANSPVHRQPQVVRQASLAWPQVSWDDRNGRIFAGFGPETIINQLHGLLMRAIGQGTATPAGAAGSTGAATAAAGAGHPGAA